MTLATVKVRINNKHAHPHLGEDNSGIEGRSCFPFSLDTAGKKNRLGWFFCPRQQNCRAERSVRFGHYRKWMVRKNEFFPFNRRFWLRSRGQRQRVWRIRALIQPGEIRHKPKLWEMEI